MTPFGSSLSGVAARLITRYGAPMVLSKTEAASYDPATGNVTGTPSDHPLLGIVESVSAAFVGGLMQNGDLLVTVAGEDLSGIRPAPGDLLRIDGAAHDVVNVTTIATGTEPLLFRLLVRR
ncbi:MULTISPECIES: hypothetical protein [Nisaea]|uniref:hypothetical protein n=1 Tax=Nisaea TaxID=390876 RepID=UPI000414D37D|nr:MULTISPECIES: hypothetical protein [Nisaea]